LKKYKGASPIAIGNIQITCAREGGANVITLVLIVFVQRRDHQKNARSKTVIPCSRQKEPIPDEIGSFVV